MRSKEQIEKRIGEIERDDRYQSGLEKPALIEINAPLALIQVSFEAELRGLKWVLEGNVKWTLVESTNIAAIGYDEEARELRVQFSSGTVYAYSEVPPEVYHDFLAAESKGKYLGAHIKGVFEYQKT